ncbi:hypothetical protein CE91St26_11390 [Akkermansia muciniphila]|nr:hypothetical protein CE91St26_11390 [Akkermansia muciniphila]GKI09057.1 hypothetical protein CE91St27_11390 [Akkermansia muciniphila]GLV03895.1 hypothetical protein Aksp01_20770 [Akkermansia sp. NBRC 115031]
MYNVAPCSPVLRTGMGENDNGFVRRKFEHLFRSVEFGKRYNDKWQPHDRQFHESYGRYGVRDSGYV